MSRPAVSTTDSPDHAGPFLVVQGRQTIRLSRSQYRLLMLLKARQGYVVPRSDLARAVYGRRAHPCSASNTIAVFVAQLRRKLGADLIVTLHGVGYCMPASA